MKQLTFILTLAIGTGFLFCSAISTEEFSSVDQANGLKNNQEINPLLGNISFVSKFGKQPTTATDEDLRIRTHLEYVENLLRQKNTAQLSTEQKTKREKILDLLHAYWTTGIFPRNYDHADKRVPCFIDKDGKICAVGYLVEQTAGRKTAEQINAAHKYDELLAMNDGAVNNWIATSGLTEEECAMIQPTYGPPPGYNYNYISPRYGISSAVLGGINMSFNVINGIQMAKGTQNQTVPVISFLSGAGSVILGAINFPKENAGGMYYHTNKSQKLLSLFNIGLGTATMVLSAWNLTSQIPKKPTGVSWNLYSFPVTGKQTGIGMSFSKRF